MRTERKIREKKEEIVRSDSFENISYGISRVWLALILIMSALVGLWGAVSLISGITESGSLAAMIKSYIEAVTGR